MGGCASNPTRMDAYKVSGTVVGWDGMVSATPRAHEQEEDEEYERVKSDGTEGVPERDMRCFSGGMDENNMTMDSVDIHCSKSDDRGNEPLGLMGGSINSIPIDVQSDNKDEKKMAMVVAYEDEKAVKLRKCLSDGCHTNGEGNDQSCHCSEISRNASALCHPSLRVDNGESLSVSNSNVHFTRVKGLHDDQRFSFYPSNYSFVNQVVQNRLVASTTSHHGTLKLVNLGNTCFMNAGLQCLLHCTPLTDYFLGIYWEDEVNLDNALGHKGVMVKAYVKLLETLWTSNSSSIHNPSDFKHTVGRIMPMFSGNKQHDVQEFVAFMLDAIHEDLNRVRGIKPYVRDLEWIEEEDQEITARKAWKGYLHRNRSIIVDLFQCQLRSQLRCLRCGYMSVKFDPFMYLSVPIPKQSMKRIITLQQCLEYFCEEEALDVKEQWFCRMCRDFVPSAKKLDLWKLTPVLIVHLKRFAYDGKRNRCRNNAKVSFLVTSLDLSNFVKSYQREPPDYDLFAVANHHGGRMSSGHYTAQALDRVMGEWNKFNDANVDPVSHSAVCSPSEKAYVLFYSKMRPGMETKSNSHPKVSKRGHFGNNHYFHRRIGIIRRQSLSKPQNWPHAKFGNQVPTPDKQQ